MVESGIYIIKDEFYERFPDPFLKLNKQENRPHYYAFRDKGTGLYWMIPLSKECEKYEAIIKRRTACHKETDFLYVADIGLKRKSAFLIGDMFPVTDDYIQRAYTLKGQSFIVTNRHIVNDVTKKAKRVLNAIRRGVKFSPTQPNVLSIENALMPKSDLTREIEEMQKLLQNIKGMLSEIERKLLEVTK